MHDVKFIRELSLETAMALFKSKILPILTYGIEVIWTHLNERPLATIKRRRTTIIISITTPTQHYSLRESAQITH